MSTDTTIQAISLGSFAELDTDEKQMGADKAGSLVGSSFGSSTAPLANSILHLGLHDADANGSLAFGNHTVGAEYITINGTRQAVDAGVQYRGTVTYMDGTSTAGVTLRIIQDGTGQLYLLPPPTDAGRPEIEALTLKPIAAITLTAVKQNNFGALTSSRYGLQSPTFLCFRHGTMILTDQGERAVETLRPGDRVMTRDHGWQAIRWIGSRRVDGSLLRAFPKMRPVRIGAGTLGPDLPRRDLYVSQQHRILVGSRIAERIFGQPEVLVAARFLTGIPGIAVDESDDGLDYFHLLFNRHEIVISEGAQTESLFTGPEALKAVSAEARAEMLALFPDLLRGDVPPVPARTIAAGRQARELARWHQANGKVMQAARA